jgi:hypothetical protein
MASTAVHFRIYVFWDIPMCAGLMFPNIWGEHSAFIFNGQGIYFSSVLSPFKTKALYPSEAGNNYAIIISLTT